ncbi:MAG: DUF6326 family protein [Bacteroidota bacterium]
MDKKLDIKTRLSSLWIFVIFNIVFRDLHEMPTKDFLEEALQGSVNGVQITDDLMLFGGILAEIMIIMPLVSLLAKYKINRLLNLIVGLIIVAFLIFNGNTDIDDIFFMIVELIALAYILLTAWKWKPVAND